MSRRVLMVVAGLWLFVSVASAAQPGDLCLSVSPERPQVGDEIVIQMMTDERHVARFQHLWKNGRTQLTDSKSTVSAGPHLISYSSQPLVVNGGTRMTRFCKLFLMVGDGALGPLRYSELGQRLEIIPQTDPALYQVGGVFELQLLIDREPLYGARVVAFPEHAPESGAQTTKTDEIGLARLRLGQPGRWIIKVVHEQECLDCDAVADEQLISTLVLSLNQTGPVE
jgi:hypothetical protein